MSASTEQEWVAEQVRLAEAGDRQAWNMIVHEFEAMLSGVARAHRLRAVDAADIAQTTWLRLTENLNRLKEPERVGAWLATTARRECLRTLRDAAREVPDPEPEPARRDDEPIDARLLRAERDAALWSAVRRLPDRDQALLGMLVADPQPSYEEIGAALDMPIGSIGPTRGRALHRLREELEHAAAPVELAA